MHHALPIACHNHAAAKQASDKADYLLSMFSGVLGHGLFLRSTRAVQRSGLHTLCLQFTCLCRCACAITLGPLWH